MAPQIFIDGVKLLFEYLQMYIRVRTLQQDQFRCWNKFISKNSHLCYHGFTDTYFMKWCEQFSKCTRTCQSIIISCQWNRVYLTKLVASGWPTSYIRYIWKLSANNLRGWDVQNGNIHTNVNMSVFIFVFCSIVLFWLVQVWLVRAS